MWPKQILMVITLVTLSWADLCTEKNCTCTTEKGWTQVNCQDKGIKDFPSFANLTEKIRSIDLSKNEIKSIPAIDEVDGMKTLTLSYNQIVEVDSEAFTKYNYLENLDLSHNHIKELKNMNGLSGLGTLDLSHNLLRNLPDDIFDTMDELKELRLSGNPLHYLRDSWFRKITRVTTLDISGCGLTSLPNGIFHNMIFLTDLDLSRNLLEVVPRALQSASKLTKLKLSGNEIERIKANSFKRCNTLEELELSGLGKLEVIFPGAFAGLKALKILKISNNPNLKEIDFGAFEGLYNSLDESWDLDELILRDNGLEEIRSPSTTLCKISTLDLQGNPWNCDCKLGWLSTCELKEELTEDLKCMSPLNLQDKLIRQTGADEMVCLPDPYAEHHRKMLRIIVVTSGLVGILFCAIIIVIVVKKRKLMEWWYYRKRGSGAVYYVKAKNGQDVRGEI